jgi:hypothetical protein
MTDEGAASGGAKSDKDDTTSKAQSKPAVQSKIEDAITALKNDHRKVEALFQSYQQSSGRTDKQKLARQICQELIVHTKLEEEIFYRACRDKGVEDDMLDEAQVEHDGAKVLINELLTGGPQDEYYDAKVKVLSEEIKHHVNEEEKRDGIFAKAKSSGLDIEALGQKLAARKAELLEEIEQNGLERPRPRSFKQRGTENTMPQGQYRDRDERGRFMSDDDDDRRYSSSRSGGGRSRYDGEDDDRRSYSSRSRGGSRYEDDDDRRGGNGGRGGWFGDSEGHAQAARQRGGGREYDDDRRGGGSRSGNGGRGQGGWFGDSEGHSEASRRGWERSDHEGSGWYGDSEGHSEASRRGWEERGGMRGRSRRDDDDDRRSYSSRSSGGRSRYEDDDDDRRSSRSSSSRGRGHGGWFGDPEGHSEASRRGWEGR